MKYDIIIIGGGIVGLASAYQLLQKNPDLKVAIVEKENAVAAHQTGHNSGVIHSGLYYKPGSLKAQNCISGYKMLIDFCDTKNIKYDLCGKIVVATSDAELPQLEMLFNRGKEYGLDKIFMIDEEKLKEYEPHVNGVKAIVVPYTGIIDYTDVSEKIADEIIRISRAKALRIALHALSPFRIGVSGLAYTRNKGIQHEWPRIGSALDEQLKLLLRSQRKRLHVRGGIKGRHHPHHPLLLLLLQLIGCCFLLAFFRTLCLGTRLRTGTVLRGRSLAWSGRRLR